MLDCDGKNVTEEALKMINERCPELLGLYLYSNIFSPPTVATLLPPLSPASPASLNGSTSSTNTVSHTALTSTNTACATTNRPVTDPQSMARAFSVPYLGKLPMDLNIMKSCEAGKSFLESYPTSVASKAFRDIVADIIKSCATKSK